MYLSKLERLLLSVLSALVRNLMTKLNEGVIITVEYHKWLKLGKLLPCAQILDQGGSRKNVFIVVAERKVLLGMNVMWLYVVWNEHKSNGIVHPQTQNKWTARTIFLTLLNLPIDPISQSVRVRQNGKDCRRQTLQLIVQLTPRLVIPSKSN